MAVKVELTLDEITTLDRILYGVLSQVDVVDDTVLTLRRIRRKLATAAPARMCTHCKERERRGREGLCARCTSYRRKYGHLPSEDTLMRSARRRPPGRRPKKGP